MQALRTQGFDDIQATCGGACACATCHVHVDASHFALLGPLAFDEDDLLDCSDHRVETSRLSCQVRVTEALDGAELAIPPEG
jgi:2Fe-2S ferredoxin